MERRRLGFPIPGWLLSVLFGCPDRRDLLAAVPLRAVAGRTPVQVFLVLAGLLFTCCLVAQGLLIGAGLAAGREKSQERASRQVAAMLLGR
jgi:hypothetical protein